MAMAGVFTISNVIRLTVYARQDELDRLKSEGEVSAADRAWQEDLSSQVSTYKSVGIAGIGVGIAAAGAAVGCYLYSNTEPESKEVKVGFTLNGVYVAADF